MRLTDKTGLVLCLWKSTWCDFVQQRHHHYFFNMFPVYVSLICCTTYTLNLCVHLVLYNSPSIIRPCFNASLPSSIYSSALIPRSISQLLFHLQAPTWRRGHSQRSSHSLWCSTVKNCVRTVCILSCPRFLPCTVDISGRFSVRVLWHSPRFVAACLLFCSRGIWGRCAREHGI